MSTEDKDSPGKYSPSEWEQIEASASFGNLPDDQVLLLYRHRVWADYARDEFVEGSGVVIINGLLSEQLTDEFRPRRVMTGDGCWTDQ